LWVTPRGRTVSPYVVTTRVVYTYTQIGARVRRPTAFYWKTFGTNLVAYGGGNVVGSRLVRALRPYAKYTQKPSERRTFVRVRRGKLCARGDSETLARLRVRAACVCARVCVVVYLLLLRTARTRCCRATFSLPFWFAKRVSNIPPAGVESINTFLVAAPHQPLSPRFLMAHCPFRTVPKNVDR